MMLRASLKQTAMTIAAASALTFAVGQAAVAASVTVATTAIIEHPVIDTIRDGIRDELVARGYVLGKDLSITYENAQGSTVTAAQIARKLVGATPDVIVPITTPSAQAVVAATDKIPVVFSAITDPVGAKLVASMRRPGANVTGTTDLSPIKQHLELIRKVTPKARKIGVIYNPGEANSVSLIRLIREHGPALDLTIVEATAPKSAEVLSAARSLVGRVDAIYLPTDNTVISVIEAVIKVGVDNQIPVFAGDADSVPRGAIAALGFNYYDVGRQTGAMVHRVLQGEAPGDMPVQLPAKLELHINPAMAKKMGVAIPGDIYNATDKVVESADG